MVVNFSQNAIMNDNTITYKVVIMINIETIDSFIKTNLFNSGNRLHSIFDPIDDYDIRLLFIAPQLCCFQNSLKSAFIKDMFFIQ